MNVKVVYATRSGNTKKLADAIAGKAGVAAEAIHGSGRDTEADLLFLGASVYAAGIDDSVKTYISELAPKKVKEVVVFSTSALAERAFPDIRRRLSDSGIQVAEENFYCRGSFLFMHKGRPNQDDLKAAEEFASEVLSRRG